MRDTPTPSNGTSESGRQPEASRCPVRSALQGAWRFALVSLGGFAVWALAGGWFYRHTGEAGLYAASTGAFIGLAGFLVPPLLPAPRTRMRFLTTFIPAFVAYAIAWCTFWFLLRFGPGEWLGSLAGSLAFVAVTAWRFGNYRPLMAAALVFFLAHSVGYFAGDQFMKFALGESGTSLFGGLSRQTLGLVAKLGWGLLYGLGFGAGLGYTYAVLAPPASGVSNAQDTNPRPES